MSNKGVYLVVLSPRRQSRMGYSNAAVHPSILPSVHACVRSSVRNKFDFRSITSVIFDGF